MMNAVTRFFALLPVAAIGACGGTEEAEECQERWEVHARPDASAQVVDGLLELRAPVNLEGALLGVGHPGVSGDFSVTLRFVDLAVAGAYTHIDMYMFAESSYAGIGFQGLLDGNVRLRGYAGSAQLYEADLFGDDYASGTVQVDRVGTSVSVALNGIGVNQGQFPSGPAELWIYFSSTLEQVTQYPIVASFEEVTVSEGGEEVWSDTFDCDSLGPAQPL